MPKKRMITMLSATIVASTALATTVASSVSAASASAVPGGVGASVSAPPTGGPVAPTGGPVARFGGSVAQAGDSSAASKAISDAQVSAQASRTTISGRASHDGKIEVYDQFGRRFGPTVTVVDGAWSMDVPPTTWTGRYTLTVSLFVDDAYAASTYVTLDWTQPIIAVGPSAPITGSTATLTGTGTVDAQITVLEDGVVVAETTAVDGGWSVDVHDITVGWHEYRVLNYSGSATVTTVKVLRQAPAAADLQVDAPADPELGYTPGTAFTFTGSAPAAATTVTIRTSAGALVATVPIDPATQTWAYTRSNMGTSVYRLVFIAGEGSPDEQRVSLSAFGPKKTDPEEAPLVFTNPSNPSLGYPANSAFTFRGKATPGSTIALLNDKGVEIAKSIVVDTNGDWSWTRSNMGTSIWKVTAVEATSTGTRQTSLKPFAPAPALPAAKPLAFTSPANPAAGYEAGESFTFRGTAPQGSTVSLQNDKGTVFASNLAVDDDGDWSWTRPNMGTSIWKVTAVATLVEGARQSSTLAPFAPAK